MRIIISRIPCTTQSKKPYQPVYRESRAATNNHRWETQTSCFLGIGYRTGCCGSVPHPDLDTGHYIRALDAGGPWDRRSHMHRRLYGANLSTFYVYNIRAGSASVRVWNGAAQPVLYPILRTAGSGVSHLWCVCRALYSRYTWLIWLFCFGWYKVSSDIYIRITRRTTSLAGETRQYRPTTISERFYRVVTPKVQLPPRLSTGKTHQTSSSLCSSLIFAASTWR